MKELEKLKEKLKEKEEEIKILWETIDIQRYKINELLKEIYTKKEKK